MLCDFFVQAGRRTIGVSRVVRPFSGGVVPACRPSAVAPEPGCSYEDFPTGGREFFLACQIDVKGAKTVCFVENICGCVDFPVRKIACFPNKAYFCLLILQ